MQLDNHSLEISSEVLVHEIDGEAVLLDLRSECYFGLDAVGLDFWNALSESPTLVTAYERLRQQYSVDDGQLQQDLLEFTQSLASQGLVQLKCL